MKRAFEIWYHDRTSADPKESIPQKIACFLRRGDAEEFFTILLAREERFKSQGSHR